MELEYVEAQQEEWVLVVEEEQVQEAMVLVVEQGQELVGSVQVVVQDPESAEVAMGRPLRNDQEEFQAMELPGGGRSCKEELARLGCSWAYPIIAETSLHQR